MNLLPQNYYAFTLAQLQGDLVAFSPHADASTLDFYIQAADAPGNTAYLSDSDLTTSTPNPHSVSVPVVPLETVPAGKEVPINDDGKLTPDEDTLDEWLAADDELEIFVWLQKGKSGTFRPSVGVVEEYLSLADTYGVPESAITVLWQSDRSRLSLAATSSGSATREDFQNLLGALRLQTVHFPEVSHRTILVEPNTSRISISIGRTAYYLREVEVSASSLGPVLEVSIHKSRVDSGERLVLTKAHMLAYDPDTPDASDISFRVTGLQGGRLQRFSDPTWSNIALTPDTDYWEFTLAELLAGKISLLAGDGLKRGDGEKIIFRVQAADNDGNLSDSDPNSPDPDPVDAEMVVVTTAKATAGFSSSLNADGILTPDTAILRSWQQNSENATLRVIVKLLGDKQTGDVLSLRSGYDASKITPDWKEKIGELWLDIGRGTTTAEIQEALALLTLDSAISDSASTREVWVFPTVSSWFYGLRYRFDKDAGLVRHYQFDNTERSFSEASKKASARILFGKKGYLGVPLSNAGMNIYKSLRSQGPLHLAITDVATEGKWLIAAGPREGLLFWDHTRGRYGPGAAGSGWWGASNFWFRSSYSNQPDNSGDEDYASMGLSDRISDVDDGPGKSITHHDLWLSEGEIFVRSVQVDKSAPNPILEVDFSKFQATATRPLVLSEDHILVDDPDTRDPTDPSKVDASSIKFRITNIPDGILKRRIDISSAWTNIDKTPTTQYREFTLAQLQGRLVALLPNAAGTLTFEIQAADNGDGTPGSPPNLSDADPYDGQNDTDPHSVSMKIVSFNTIYAARELPINEDEALTPDVATLEAWFAEDRTLRIFVVLGGGKEGIITLAAGLVKEYLSVGTHGVADSKIAVSWDADNWRLALQGSDTATQDDFRDVLRVLQLQTVHSDQTSHRTILVKPDISVSVARAAYYVREVRVVASTPHPLLQVDLAKSRADSGQRFLLTEENIFVYDPDTPDASLIEFRVTGLTGGRLQRRSSGSASDWRDIVANSSEAYLKFTLAELRAGQIAFLAGDGLASADGGEGKKIVFRIQAADDGLPGVQDSPAHLSDSDPNDDDADPVTSEIPIIVTAKATAGIRSSLNADRVLTPNDPTLSSWKQTATTYRGTLHVVAKLLDKRIGDVLSLRSGYDTSKVTFRWDGSKGELSMKFDSGASISEIKTALEFLELDTKVASSASTRKVRIFPTLSVVPGFGYRFDETTGSVHYYVNDTVFQSFLLDGKIFARLVEVEESPPNPILWVDSGKFQTTSLRRLVLSEYHIRLDDVDTRDPSDDTKVDGSKITFRVRGISGARLQHLFEGNWRDIPSRNQIQEFTLRQLREGLVSLLPNAAGTLTFEIQAADDDSHLSDSDYYDNEDDADPLGVSIRVVALKEIYAGKEMPVSDDRRATAGDGGLTPSDATLHAWIGDTTSGRLKVLVRLEGGKRGDALFLEDGHGVTTITNSWSWDGDTAIGTLSLQSDGTATVDDFQAVLNALALRTVRSASASVRTISVRPDIAAEVPQKDYYARDVLIRESGPRPYVGERKTAFLQFGRDDRAILLPSLFLVEDFDTPASRRHNRDAQPALGSGTAQERWEWGVYQNHARERCFSGVYVGGIPTRVDGDIFVQSAWPDHHL